MSRLSFKLTPKSMEVAIQYLLKPTEFSNSFKMYSYTSDNDLRDKEYLSVDFLNNLNLNKLKQLKENEDYNVVLDNKKKLEISFNLEKYKVHYIILDYNENME